MTQRLAFSIIGCLAILGVMALGAVGPRSWLGAAGTARSSDRAAASSPDSSKTAAGQASERAKGRALLVSVRDFPGSLQRPPVRFDHDQHTGELGPESCDLCHRQEESGDFLFAYPKARRGSGRNALMNSFHDSCIGCHQQRKSRGKESGPVTCGECHVLDREHAKKQYVPVLPEYYEVLRDTYHRECIACHREPAKKAEDAGPLDWQAFYLAQQKQAERHWPKVVFDYYLHDKHDKALDKQCRACHTISPARMQKLFAEGRMPSGRDWVQDFDESNDLTERTVAHARCINCHVKRKVQGAKAGPVECGECHSGVERTAQQMADVARPKCDQDERILMRLEHGARARPVPFNHKSHVAKTRSCQECHHKTLRACDECHGEKATAEGGWVTLAEAHHKVTSTFSCVGCHEKEKSKPDCAGCHQGMQHGLVQSACTGCHSGSLDKLDATPKLPAPEDLIAADTKPKLQLGEIENEYAPSTMPHLEIVKRLTDASNANSLARHFHTSPTTMCAGCHHYTPLEAKKQPPRCSTCHTTRNEPVGKLPTLLGAYHQQCLGCHRNMDRSGGEMPQDCVGCHEEKLAAQRRD